MVNPASRRRTTDRPRTATAATHPIHAWSPPAAAAPTRHRAAPRLTGRMPRTASADPPTVERANDAACSRTTSTYATANTQAASPNASGVAIAITRKQAIAASIGRRVEVVLGPTLLLSHA